MSEQPVGDSSLSSFSEEIDGEAERRSTPGLFAVDRRLCMYPCYIDGHNHPDSPKTREWFWGGPK